MATFASRIRTEVSSMVICRRNNTLDYRSLSRNFSLGGFQGNCFELGVTGMKIFSANYCHLVHPKCIMQGKLESFGEKLLFSSPPPPPIYRTGTMNKCAVCSWYM